MATKVRRDFKSGIEGIQNIWSNKIGRHMEELEMKKQRDGMGVVLAIIPQIFSLGFAIFIIWTARPTSSLFSWHPTLMSLAFVVLMMEAIVFFSPWFTLNPSLPRDTKTFWHWFLHSLSIVCAYTGLAVITVNKHNNNYPHYTTWHGVLGIIVCCCITIQASGGIIEMFPSLLPFKVSRVILKRLHAISGTVTYIGAMVTVVLGLYSKWFTSNVTNIVVWSAVCCCPVVMMLIVLVQFIRNHFMLMIGRY